MLPVDIVGGMFVADGGKSCLGVVDGFGVPDRGAAADGEVTS